MTQESQKNKITITIDPMTHTLIISETTGDKRCAVLSRDIIKDTDPNLRFYIYKTILGFTIPNFVAIDEEIDKQYSLAVANMDVTSEKAKHAQELLRQFTIRMNYTN